MRLLFAHRLLTILVELRCSLPGRAPNSKELFHKGSEELASRNSELFSFYDNDDRRQTAIR